MSPHKKTHKSPQNNKCCFAETAESETNPVISVKAPIALSRTRVKDELEQTSTEDVVVLGALEET